MDWKFKPGLPIYTQIVEQMKLSIAKGVYKPGEKLPAVRELAMEAAVNPNTMQRALTEMEREGLFYTERTNGRFVTKEEETLDKMRIALGEEFIRELFTNLEKMGMNKEQIVKAVAKWAEEAEK
ncbi:MAG: GntR family transcriptional regulator [Anaerovoracaceae bacterium]